MSNEATIEQNERTTVVGGGAGDDAEGGQGDRVLWHAGAEGSGTEESTTDDGPAETEQPAGDAAAWETLAPFSSPAGGAATAESRVTAPALAGHEDVFIVSAIMKIRHDAAGAASLPPTQTSGRMPRAAGSAVHPAIVWGIAAPLATCIPRRGPCPSLPHARSSGVPCRLTEEYVRSA